MPSHDDQFVERLVALHWSDTLLYVRYRLDPSSEEEGGRSVVDEAFALCLLALPSNESWGEARSEIVRVLDREQSRLQEQIEDEEQKMAEMDDEAKLTKERTLKELIEDLDLHDMIITELDNFKNKYMWIKYLRREEIIDDLKPVLIKIARSLVLKKDCPDIRAIVTATREHTAKIRARALIAKVKKSGGTI